LKSRDLSLAQLGSVIPPGRGRAPDPVTSPTMAGKHRRRPFWQRAARAAARGAALYAAAGFMTVSLAFWQVYARLEARRALEASGG
jgi:hypothetical protein